MAREDLTPAERMLYDDDYQSTPVIFKEGCYICEDPDYRRMGLPLCRRCTKCGGHVAADDTICDDCGHDALEGAPTGCPWKSRTCD